MVSLNNIQSANSDGVDIVFVDVNNISLDFEIEQYDDIAGNLTSWVNIPTLAENSDTEFYVYYGNDQIVQSIQSPASVWGDSYESVWHMEDTLDSTSKNHDGANNGATSMTGKIGDAYDFDGNNDYIALDMSFENNNTLDTMTASAWVKVAPNTGAWSILDFDRSEWFTFTIGGTVTESNKVGFHTTAPSIHDFSGNSIVADGTWHLVHVVYDGTDKIIYVDGIEDARNTNSHSGNDLGQGQSKRYGFIGDGSEATTFDANKNNIYFEGMADEIRFSMDAKSIHWIATEWNNQNDPGSFYNTSDVQSVYD